MPVPNFEPEPVEVHMEEHEEIIEAAEVPMPPQPPAPRADADPFDDIDTPAFLRRERKLFS